MATRLADSIPVEPLVLAWARESLRMPIDAAAERLRVPAETLEAWERDGGSFRLTQLEKMASIFHRPVAAFFLKSVPAEPPFPSDHRTLPSQVGHDLGPQTVLAVRFAQRLQGNTRDLSLEMGRQLVVSLPRAELSGVADSLAARMRRALGIKIESQLKWRDDYLALREWTAAAERLGVLVLRQRMPLDETRAFSLAGEPAVVVLNSKDKPRPRVFSLAHELVHIALGTSSICDTGLGPYNSASQQIETFCNRVAGAILVPEATLALQESVAGTRTDSWDEHTLRNLAALFSVSQEVILRRLLIMGKASEAFYRAKRSEWKRRPTPSRKPGRAQNSVDACLQEHGRAFVHLVADANGRDHISAAEAASVLDVNIRHLDAVFERAV